MTATLVDPALSERLALQGDTPLPMFELDPNTRSCDQCGESFTRADGESRYSFNRRVCCSRVCADRRKTRLRVTAPANQKTCEQCTQQFTRPARQAQKDFAERKYCSPACVKADRLPDVYQKACEQCGTQWDVPTGRRRDQMARRRFCSQDCSAAFSRRDRAVTRVCEWCAGTFTRRIGSETVARFNVRPTCSRSCSAKHRAAQRPTMPADTKLCEQCSNDVTRRASEDTKHWTARRFCSHACVYASRRSAPVVKPPKKPRVVKAKVTPPPMPIPAAPPRQPVPVWRPAGWSAAPPVVVRVVSDVAS